MEIRCPQCKKSYPAKKWILCGTVTQAVTIQGDEIQVEEDLQPTYFISHAICPSCGEEFELINLLKLEWYEDPSKLYSQLSQQPFSK